MKARLVKLKNYPPYAVTENGDVWSFHKKNQPRKLKPGTDGKGYLQVFLYVNGKMIKFRIHTLVCLAFHGPRPTPQHEVCHNDGTRLNNHKDNLRWGTRKDNAADRAIHGTNHYKGNAVWLKETLTKLRKYGTTNWREMKRVKDGSNGQQR